MNNKLSNFWKKHQSLLEKISYIAAIALTFLFFKTSFYKEYEPYITMVALVIFMALTLRVGIILYKKTPEELAEEAKQREEELKLIAELAKKDGLSVEAEEYKLYRNESWFNRHFK